MSYTETNETTGDGKIQVSARIPAALAERLDAVAAALAARVPGMTFRRSDALRAAVERGLEALEAEIHGARAPVATAKRPAPRKPSPGARGKVRG